MNRLARITILICVLLVLASCQPMGGKGKVVQADLPRVKAPEVSDEQVSQLSEGNNAFAFDLYHSLDQEKNGNLIYSPYSIWLVFSMVYGGAQGQTASQMAEVFNFLSQDNQHVTLNAVDQRLEAFGTAKTDEDDGTPFQLDLANAVWAQQGYAFKQPFLDLMAAQYGAGLHVLDFQAAAEEAREAINTWVEENTGGRIKEMASPGSISPDTRMVLTNAILFKAGWQNEFDQDGTADGLFTLSDGTQVTVPLMHLRAQLSYLEKQDYQAVRLPYATHQVEMWVILPAEGRFEAVRDELSTDLMNEIKQQAGYAEVTLSMPKFEFESDLSLREQLMQMGLTQAFCPAGDFSGIADGGGLCIGNAIHKAMIKVDEQGTEATAATMVVMMASIMEEVTLTIDRPFFFAIVVPESGLILFLGQVVNPAIN